MQQAVPNVGSDPINPAYYAGTACAEIIEHMPTNVGFAAKYAWRLGEKDSISQEASKAIWYLKRQLKLSYMLGFIDTREPYRRHADLRINAASDAGKLDITRRAILVVLVKYTLTGEKRQLETAIELFETFLGNEHENNQ